MCGIAGIAHLDGGRSVEPERLGAMVEAIAHRGPDDRGYWLDGQMGLGHCRLAIIDLASGHQPMSNEDDRLWISYNGEIYNYLELRRELTGDHQFATNTDTEVILHAYESDGPRCLDRLNGMFAFALYDCRRRELFLARDRLGVKPLYWCFDGEMFAFASEIKALFASGLLRPEVNPEGLEEYIAFQWCLGSKTMFRGVHRLEPGCWLRLRLEAGARPEVRSYWELRYEIDTGGDGESFAAQVRAMTEDAVGLQLRSDVPVGAHLSGGLDSSLVVSLTSGLVSEPMHTFTGAFRDGPAYDETSFARLVAREKGTLHNEIWCSADDLAESMTRLAWLMDEPAGGPGLLPQYLVSRQASRQVKVVLGGQGGDEIFGGYTRYLVAYLEQCLKGAIFGSAQAGQHVVTLEQIVPNLPSLQEYVPMLRYFWREGLFEDMDARYYRLIRRCDGAEELFTPQSWSSQSEERIFERYREHFHMRPAGCYLTAMTDFDRRTLLPALLHVEDRTSMGWSLESRVPLLDHRLVELAASMPPVVRFGGGRRKAVLLDAARGVVPEQIINRRDKMGFPVPLVEWMRGPARDFFRQILLDRQTRQRGLFRTDRLEQQLSVERRFDRRLWGLLCLELWFRSFFDHPLSGVADAVEGRAGQEVLTP